MPPFFVPSHRGRNATRPLSRARSCRLEQPDEQENDENQDDNAATDVHASSSFGWCVNEAVAGRVTVCSEMDDELRAGPFRLPRPRVGDALERIDVDRELDLACGGVGDEVEVG